MLALLLPLVAYLVFALTLTWLASLARDRYEARKRRAWSLPKGRRKDA